MMLQKSHRAVRTMLQVSLLNSPALLAGRWRASFNYLIKYRAKRWRMEEGHRNSWAAISYLVLFLSSARFSGSCEIVVSSMSTKKRM